MRLPAASTPRFTLSAVLLAALAFTNVALRAQAPVAINRNATKAFALCANGSNAPAVREAINLNAAAAKTPAI